jgi:hypothetical protein
MWGDQRAVINPNQPQTQARLVAAAAARLPGSAGNGGAGMSSADAQRRPLRRHASDDNQPRMLHWSTSCAPATPMHSRRSYGRGHR